MLAQGKQMRQACSTHHVLTKRLTQGTPAVHRPLVQTDFDTALIGGNAFRQISRVVGFFLS